MVVLRTDKMTKRFGGLVAVNELNLDIERGQIYALIGPNGSGKTTALNLITGVYPADSGKITFEGEEIQGQPPHWICRRGISRTFQNIRILESQTVFDNVRLGKHFSSKAGLVDILLQTPRFWKDHAQTRDAVNKALDFVGLTDLANERAANLSYGKKRILEIARALVTEPKLLLLDEPAAGLNSQEIHGLMDLIRRISKQGVTILLVEHRMELVGGLADRVVVLNYGSKISEGNFAEIKEDPAVVEAYLGRRRQSSC